MSNTRKWIISFISGCIAAGIAFGIGAWQFNDSANSPNVGTGIGGAFLAIILAAVIVWFGHGFLLKRFGLAKERIARFLSFLPTFAFTAFIYQLFQDRLAPPTFRSSWGYWIIGLVTYGLCSASLITTMPKQPRRSKFLIASLVLCCTIIFSAATIYQSRADGRKLQKLALQQLPPILVPSGYDTPSINTPLYQYPQVEVEFNSVSRPQDSMFLPSDIVETKLNTKLLSFLNTKGDCSIENALNYLTYESYPSETVCHSIGTTQHGDAIWADEPNGNPFPVYAFIERGQTLVIFSMPSGNITENEAQSMISEVINNSHVASQQELESYVSIL